MSESKKALVAEVDSKSGTLVASFEPISEGSDLIFDVHVNVLSEVIGDYRKAVFDKTYDEIKHAINDGKVIRVSFNDDFGCIVVTYDITYGVINYSPTAVETVYINALSSFGGGGPTNHHLHLTADGDHVGYYTYCGLNPT